MYFLILLIFFTSISSLYSNSLKDSIDIYYYSFNYKKIESLVIEIDTSNTYNQEYKSYYKGILQYCLGRIYYNYNKEKAYKNFEFSLENFKIANQLNKKSEYIALISAAYGKLSSLNILKAIFYGIEAKKYIEEAYKLSPNDTKVLIVAATHLMHTPEFYGGNKKLARELLFKILEINKLKNTNDKDSVNWGTDAEAFAYLAQLEILLENKIEAEKYMKKALEIIPYYGFVKIDLNNQLKKLK